MASVASRLSNAYAAAGRAGLLESVTWFSSGGPVAAQGRIRRPSGEAFDGLVAGDELIVRVLSSDWPDVAPGDTVRVGGLDHRVAQVVHVSDGAQIDVRLVQ